MPKRSAGILMYRRTSHGLEVLLVHPGGPFWAKKDKGAWSIPKGEYDEEEPLACAIREFEEELGQRPQGEFVALGEVRQAGGKIVAGFAVQGDFDAAKLVSNMFEMEWPPKSGKLQSFPEIDRAQWFTADEARLRINPAQSVLIDRLVERLG
jgi:predicted NUDIX family NTP pyrophosphohydrolase